MPGIRGNFLAPTPPQQGISPTVLILLVVVLLFTGGFGLSSTGNSSRSGR